jgi:acyl-coenzyme A thioesterase PaaI-like protein
MDIFMSDYIEIPTYRTCFVCGKDNPKGLHIGFRTEGSFVTADLCIDREHCGYDNIVHGGIVSAILDEGLGWTDWNDSRKQYLTMELKVRFRKPMRPNVHYMFRGERTRNIGKVYFAKGTITDNDGNIVAEGEGKYFTVESVDNI